MQPKKSISDKKTTSPKRAAKAKLISSKLAFKGKVFNVYADTVVETNGHKHVREVIRHNGSVVILAVDESVDPALIQAKYVDGVLQVSLPLAPGKERVSHEIPVN